ncbi:hypothetical protein NJF54_24365 [Pseudomonas guariconensis]|uniref:MrpH family fimbial adhesin n=1 Tax=Pseudomonas guariconensis TaxID=1288410 RepID=UPI00209AB462|nr:hypothetical protein [Pseudomonas guariconensis]MCO7634958.1 hypothetical protein [Pseudomonas guariconensis]
MLRVFVRFIWFWSAFIIADAARAVAIEVDFSRNEYDGVRYFFTVTQWEGGGDNFCQDLTARTCNLTISGIGPGNNYHFPSSYYWYNLPPNSTMTRLFTLMADSFGVGSTQFRIPFKGSLYVPYRNMSICIGFMQQFRYGGTSNEDFYPIGPCAAAMEPPAKCEINGSPTIDHGRVTDNIESLNLSSAETTLQLTCTGRGTVMASASKESPTGIKLRADGSLYSKITIEGKPAAAGVRINVEKGLTTPITIKSQLYSNGVVKPGTFSGSTVLTIAPP